MNEAIRTESRFRGDDNLMSDYAVREKAYRDTQAIMDFREKKGIARGIEIGKARGIEIGEARGIEIGEARERARAQVIIDRLEAQIAELQRNAAKQN